jgi:membrane protease YdiL (CAAX protease family)
LRVAALAEAGLVLVALALGAWLGVAPFAELHWTWRGLAWGIAATAPLLLVLAWCLRTTFPPIARLVHLVEEHLPPLFAGSTTLELLALSAMAGLGEEALFRGVIQTALAGHLPPWAAVALTALLFGAAHWLTTSYAVLAAFVGAYLGWLLLASGNLLVPIVAHAVYDLVALSVLVRRSGTARDLEGPGAS